MFIYVLFCWSSLEGRFAIFPQVSLAGTWSTSAALARSDETVFCVQTRTWSMSAALARSDGTVFFVQTR